MFVCVGVLGGRGDFSASVFVSYLYVCLLSLSLILSLFHFTVYIGLIRVNCVFCLSVEFSDVLVSCVLSAAGAGAGAGDGDGGGDGDGDGDGGGIKMITQNTLSVYMTLSSP